LHLCGTHSVFSVKVTRGRQFYIAGCEILYAVDQSDGALKMTLPNSVAGEVAECKVYETVYVAVVTYNAEKWISFFAEPLAHLPDGWKVIVIDNASTDSTVSLLRANYPDFSLIVNNTNLGFGCANNIAMKKALDEGAAFVLLLNQDAQICVEDIHKLVAMQKKYPEYLVISPIHMTKDNVDLETGFSQYSLPASCPGLYADALKGKIKELYCTSYVPAAIWLLSRTCLQRIGGFNPVFFLYGEDDEYMKRIAYHSYKLGIVPSAFARHHREGKAPVSNIIEFSHAVLDLADPVVPISILILCKRIMKNIIKNCLLCDFRKAFTACKIWLHVMRLNKKIIKNRELVKKQGCRFLQ
jgi:GT2 family glycosyltransferase